MNRRILLSLAALFGLSYTAKADVLATTRWTPPPGTKSIRIRSYDGTGGVVMDRTIQVTDDQTFRVDALKE